MGVFSYPFNPIALNNSQKLHRVLAILSAVGLKKQCSTHPLQTVQAGFSSLMSEVRFYSIATKIVFVNYLSGEACCFWQLSFVL